MIRDGDVLTLSGDVFTSGGDVLNQIGHVLTWGRFGLLPK